MKSNTRFNKNKRGIECLNCHQPLHPQDNFCSNCGQVNDTKSLSIKQYITELLGGFFAFDTRTINTLISLLTKPGKVSKEYIEGKRMQYVNPFQLYLHVSIIFFLMTSVFIGIDTYKNLTNVKSAANQQQKDTIENNVNTNKYQEEIIKNVKLFITHKKFLETINDTLINKTAKNKRINKLLSDRLFNLHAVLKKDSLFKKDPLFKYKKFKKEYLKQAVKELNASNYEIKLIEQKPNRNVSTSVPFLKKYATFYNSKTTEPIKGLDSLSYNRSAKNIYFYKKLQNFKKVFKAGEEANAYKSNLISKLSVALFFMLPIFTLFLSLLYIRNKNNYTEHLIFVFNTQTMFFILVLIGFILDRILNSDLFSSIALFVFLFYLYKAMRTFYRQRRFKTIVKLLTLNIVYFFLAVLGFIFVGLLAIVM